MSTGKKKLSRSFQNWLLLLVIAAFLTTTAFLWIIQTKLAMENTVRLLELNILDVRSDIKDASDENLLELTEQIAREVNGAETVTGDLLYLYTDGVTEATDVANNLYGEARLQAVLQQKNVGEVETVCRQVKENVDNFVGYAPQFDDITMLALKYTPAEEDTV